MRFRIFIIFMVTLIPLTTSFDLKCTPMTGGFGSLGTISYCTVKPLNITSPNETITSVNGATTPTTIEGLLFESNVVHYLPKGIGKFFPQLRALQVYSSGLKSIQAADLEGLSNLESLYIWENSIEELSSDLLKFTPKVNYLYFASNQIRRVGKYLLTNITSFQRISFSNNKCINSAKYSDFEDIKNELRTKCPHPNEQLGSEVSKKPEIASLKTESSQKEAEMGKEIDALKSQKSSIEVEISQLKTEIERLKRTCYHGLLDSSTKLLHKLTRQLNDCKAARTTVDKVETVADVLKVLSASEKETIVEMNVKSPESKVTKIVDAAGNDVQPNQTEIIIDQQNALFLPVNLGQFFPSVRRISVTFSGLYGLDPRTFIGMQNLFAINFTGNKLVEITGDAFAGLSNLTELDLSSNNIEIIHEEAFEKNVNLEILRLTQNQLTAINSPIFKHQQKLRMLFINDNKLKFINALLLSTLKALEVVDLRNNLCIDFALPNNTLQHIEYQISDKCIAAVELKCNHVIQDNQTDETHCEAEGLVLINPETILSIEIADKGGKIQKLSIVDQKMFFMPSKISGTLPNLIQLVVEKTQLTALRKTDFKGLTLLQEITIVRNNISIIEEGVFDEVPHVTYLSLAFNCIKSLPPMTFVKLTNLETLIFSGNQLKTFTASLLPTSPVITDIHLRENLLEMIEGKAIKLLENAELIDLSNNTCIDMTYLKSDVKGTSLRDILGQIELECVASEEQL